MSCWLIDFILNLMLYCNRIYYVRNRTTSNSWSWNVIWLGNKPKMIQWYSRKRCARWFYTKYCWHFNFMQICKCLFSILCVYFFSVWSIIKKKKEYSPVSRKSDSSSNSDNGQWADLIRRRNHRLNELKREFQGWTGTHEQHCILHDVLSKWFYDLL